MTTVATPAALIFRKSRLFIMFSFVIKLPNILFDYTVTAFKVKTGDALEGIWTCRANRGSDILTSGVDKMRTKNSGGCRVNFFAWSRGVTENILYVAWTKSK
jgi:hypothetical protein